MLGAAAIADPGQAHPADDRVIAAFCRAHNCAVAVREGVQWTLIGSPVGVEFPVVFVDYVPGHFSALDLPASEKVRATAAVLRWPAAINFVGFSLEPVITPGARQMCFWYAAARSLARWRGEVLQDDNAWTAAALRLKTVVYAALTHEMHPSGKGTYIDHRVY